MEWKRFFQTWHGLNFTAKAQQLLIAVLAVSNVILGWSLASRNAVVTLNPPPTAEAVDVGRSHADPQFERLWASYVARLAGNVTAARADQVRTALKQMLDSSIRAKVLSAVNADLTKIRKDNVSIEYSVRKVRYDIKGNGRVHVVGRTTITGVTQQSTSTDRTYVIDVAVDDYQPKVTYFDSYAGTPEGA